MTNHDDPANAHTDCLHCRTFPDEQIRYTGEGSEENPLMLLPTDVEATMADIENLPGPPSDRQ